MLSGTDLGEPLEFDTANIMHVIYLCISTTATTPVCPKTVNKTNSRFHLTTMQLLYQCLANIGSQHVALNQFDILKHWSQPELGRVVRQDQVSHAVSVSSHTSSTLLRGRPLIPINSFRSWCASPESTKDPHASAV